MCRKKYIFVKGTFKNLNEFLAFFPLRILTISPNFILEF